MFIAFATNNGDGTISAGTLNTGTAITYQWILCSGALVDGATDQTFTPAANGSYAVIIADTVSDCSHTSECVLIQNVGLNSLTGSNITLFPNPTKGEVRITMTGNATIRVLDTHGKLLREQQTLNGGIIDFSQFSAGVYFLEIQTGEGILVKKVVKEG